MSLATDPHDGAPGSHPPPPARPEVPAGMEPAEPAREEPGWSPAMALVCMVTAFVVAGLFASVVLIAAGGDADDSPPGATIAATLVQDGLLIGFALWFASMSAKPRAWHFGLNPTKLGPAAGWTLLAYVGFLVLSFAFLSAVGADQADELPQELGAGESLGATIGVAVLVTFLAPVVEEVFFRGYLYGALRKWGVAVAALLTGVLFGAVHAGGSDAAFLVPLAVLGAILCLLREKTGSLYPPIAVHWLNNCIALSAALSWSWEVPVTMALSGAAILLVLLGVRRLDPMVRPAPA